MDIEAANNLINNYGEEELKTFMLKYRIESFKRGDFDFITKSIAINKAGNWDIGDEVNHDKQKKALEILTNKEHHHFLYGGAAGGAKTWTGVCWMLFSCLLYPDIKCFIARKELKSILESVYPTFKKVCKQYGIPQDIFKFNAVKNFIEFKNGSIINLIDVAYQPSDPMYEIVGSTEYTLGWLEEVGEIHYQAYLKLSTRIGRQYNEEYGLVKKLYMTCNPKQNWAKTNFYDKHRSGLLYEENKILLPNGELPSQKIYLNCLVIENPFIGQGNINELMTKAREDKPTYERLFKGNWDYDDNPYQLAEQEMIDCLFENDQVEKEKTYLTADIARYGADKAVFIAWDGWIAKEIITIPKSSLQDNTNAINGLRRKYKIPKHRCIADGDGVGGFAIDATGILSFKNNGSVIKVNKETPNYRNLQVQCLYMLADKINEGGLYIYEEGIKTQGLKENIDEIKIIIKQELAQIQSRPNKRDSEKLDIKTKEEVKRDLGRSPDYRDALLMRVFFDLKKSKLNLKTTWS